MRSVEEQQARVSAAAVAPRPVRVAIAEAQGLMCAEEVIAERPMPAFDQAAIDGYAVRSVDVFGAEAIGDSSEAAERDAAAVTLPVLGTIEAGARTPTRLQPKLATRIQTGAPMPT
ncbi:MAG: molybdopterin molybdenumtransferase, partial [Mycolicibacter sinensis]